MSSVIKHPVIRYHGGKWRLASWIISHFPPHRLYRKEDWELLYAEMKLAYEGGTK